MWGWKNFLEFNGIYLNSSEFYEFPDVLLSSELYFRDIWETRDWPTDGQTDGRTDGRTDIASYRDAYAASKKPLLGPSYGG